MSNKVVFLNGCFDLFHQGHLHIIQQAVKIAQGGKVVIGVNDDDSVRSLKKVLHRTYTDRAYVLNHIVGVSCVLRFRGKDATELVDMIRPTDYVTGEEYRSMSPEARLVASYGGDVHYVPRLSGFSSTEMAKSLEATPKSKGKIGSNS